MSEQNAPKVFVSHATEDKERFVRSFATRLRERGIDAWYDEWEIQAGDSLVDKIFEQGLKDAQTVIVVLSNISVQKPWVREELNTGVVKRINKQTRLIPVIIDSDCPVPVALQATKWVRVPNLESYDDALTQIENAIYGISNKPTLGEPPRHVQLAIDKMPGLSSIDTQVFKAVYDVVLSGSNHLFVEGQKFVKLIEELDISDKDLEDSIHILHDRNLIEAKWLMGGALPIIKTTTHGFENYGKFYIADFDQLTLKILLSISNSDVRIIGEIADNLGETLVMTEFLLDVLNKRKYIRLSKFMGDSKSNVRVNEITAQGKRFLERQE